jgi:acetoin utilization deacetylase AcuC-like enzyme
MTTLIVSHPACLQHVTPPGHPERPDRLRAIDDLLADARFADLARLAAPEATFEMLALCHSEHEIEEIRHIAPKQGFAGIDADTTMSPGSLEAALRSAGGAVAAVEAVIERRAANAFVATRPPGHHAEIGRAMGFCLFNNAAIAARHAQRKYGVDRVAVVDFDVHHGNGTQDIFWADRSVMYCSTHQMPLFPGSGDSGERGDHDTVVNAPLSPGDGGDEFRAAFEALILPRLRGFAPELLIVSAGFDAHFRDPLANINLRDADFEWVTQKLMDVADARAGGRLVSVLEGGYDLAGLRSSVDAHVTALMRG